MKRNNDPIDFATALAALWFFAVIVMIASIVLVGLGRVLWSVIS